MHFIKNIIKTIFCFLSLFAALNANAQNYDSVTYIKNNITNSGNATVGYVLCARNGNDCQEQINYTTVHNNDVVKIGFSLPYDFLFIKNVSYKENGKTKTTKYDEYFCPSFAGKPTLLSRLTNYGLMRDLITCQELGLLGEAIEQ